MMEQTIIGREEEMKILRSALQSSEAEMVAVIGRRRVGKTFLVRQFFQQDFAFDLTGTQEVDDAVQLSNFAARLKTVSGSSLPVKEPKDWFEAFELLRQYLVSRQTMGKQIVFLDELPWFAQKSKAFTAALGYFWNSWAAMQPIVLLICGSAASWMIENVINDTGGLYNRVTRRIFLSPFTLNEVETYLKARHIHFTRFQIAQLCMVMGGIPHYLKEIDAGKSAIQNINDICFQRNGILHQEFDKLYPALFPNSNYHIAIIRALASKLKGMTRQEIANTSKVPNGGGLTKTLNELQQSDFIAEYQPFEKQKKEKLFRLSDEYSFFYLRFIENQQLDSPDAWNLAAQSPEFKTWSGYAFENLCLKHIQNLKKALGIAGVLTRTYSFFAKGSDTQKGAQIDLLIDRNDGVINLCEIKYHAEPYTLTKAEADALRNKIAVFKAVTGTRKHIMPVLIAPFGVLPNAHSLELLPAQLSMDDLFS